MSNRYQMVLTQEELDGLLDYVKNLGIPPEGMVTIALHQIERKHGRANVIEFLKSMVDYLTESNVYYKKFKPESTNIDRVTEELKRIQKNSIDEV